MRLVYELKRDQRWAKRGASGWLRRMDRSTRGTRGTPDADQTIRSRLCADGARIDVTAADLALRFDAETRRARSSLRSLAASCWRRAPQLSLWRAPTDNDGVRLAPRIGGVLPKWQRWNLDAPQSHGRTGRASPRCAAVRSSSNEPLTHRLRASRHPYANGSAGGLRATARCC